jgi:hypothetical protein
MPPDSQQLRLLNAIVEAATATGREAVASIGLDEQALSHAMLIAGNVLCLMAQSRLEAAGVDEDEMDSTIQGAVEVGVAYTLLIERELHSLKH